MIKRHRYATRPAKAPTSRAVRAAKRAAAIPSQQQGDVSPLESLLELMNDKSVPVRLRDRIAVKLARYCHPKPKPMRPDQLHELVTDHDEIDNDDAVSDSQQRERIRTQIFRRFD